MAELLAPAGSLDTVRAAIDAGADAIYLGGKGFNARKFAHNLNEEEMAQAVRMAHLAGVKIYVTVNILMADAEIPDLTAYLKQLDDLAVDGIIVQDLAVAAIVRRVVPHLPLHGSTQMTVSDLNGVRFLERLGFTQVVLARELPLTEIQYICAHAHAAIEIFIHGASCMAYSGQCLMSSFIGGRSGNRGACAQPCRLPYQLYDGDTALTRNESYILSLKDLNSSSYIHELLSAGVSSLKIEGRMKGCGYVRSVVGAYRSILDSWRQPAAEQKRCLREAEEQLNQSFNRTYQSDFLKDHLSRHTITADIPGNRVPDTGAADPGLTRKIPVYGHVDCDGQGNLRLTLWDESGHTAEAVSSFQPELANRRPATQSWVEGQLARLGDTCFTLQGASVWDEKYMIPASILNELRRDAAIRLEQDILSGYDRPSAGRVETDMAFVRTASIADTAPCITVRCDSPMQAEAALKAGAGRIIYGGETYDHHFVTAQEWNHVAALAASYGRELWAATPRVMWPRQAAAVRTELRLAAKAGISGVYAGNVGIFPLLESEGLSLPCSADWSLNIFNSESAQVYIHAGCCELTLSPELTLKQISRIVRHVPVPAEVLAEGRIEMMITEFCQAAAFLSKDGKGHCHGACGGRHLSLKDRHGMHFPVVTDPFCRNHILNNRDLDMAPYYKQLQEAHICRLRIEGRGRSADWVSAQTARYVRLLEGRETMVLGKEDQHVTRGHFFHGIV